MSSKTQKITKEQLLKDVDSLCDDIIRSGFIPEILYVVTCGGLIPWYYVAKRLGITNVRTICINSYEDDEIEAWVFQWVRWAIKVSEPIKMEIGKNILILDDLVDSGGTFNYIRWNVWLRENVKYAVLYKKGTHEEWLVDYHVKKYPHNVWLEFYYEIFNSYS